MLILEIDLSLSRVLDPETGTLYHNISDPPPLGIGVRCITRPGESSDEVGSTYTL